jgi:hypothetical protein
MDRRLEVFSGHEIQEANFELLRCFMLLLVRKGLIKQEEVMTMCSFAKQRLKSGAAPADEQGHVASA